MIVRLAALVLGWEITNSPLCSVNLPFHPQRPGLEIEIIPLESQKLAPPQASGNLQQKQFIAAILPGLDQQTLDLVRSEHLHFPGLGGRKPAAVCGVTGNQLLGERHLQCGAERGMTAPHRLVGEAAAIVTDMPVLVIYIFIWMPCTRTC